MPKIKKEHLLYFCIALLFLMGIIVRLIAFNNNYFVICQDECHSLSSLKKDFCSYIIKYEGGANFIQGYKFLLKSIYSLFEFNYLAFKIPSLLAGILSLFVFTSLSLKVFKNKILVLVALFIFIFSPTIINYCTQIKPYEIDLLLNLLIINAFIGIYNEGVDKFLSSKKIFIYLPLAIIFIYTSTPAIAVMGLCSAILFFDTLIKKDKKNIKKLIIINLILLTFIGIEYFTYINIMQADIGVKEQWYYDHIFAPKSLEAVNAIFSFSFLTFFWWERDNPYHLNEFILITFLVMFFIGTINSLYKNEFIKGLFYTIPVYFFLILSYMNIYPFTTRPIVFLIPLLIIIPLKSLDFDNKYLKVILTLFALFICFKYYQTLSINLKSMFLSIKYNNNNIMKENVNKFKNIKDDSVVIATNVICAYCSNNPNIKIINYVDFINGDEINNELLDLFKDKQTVYFSYNVPDISKEEINIFKKYIINNSFDEIETNEKYQEYAYIKFKKKD